MTNRPESVRVWLKGKRKLGNIPIEQVQTFVPSWWAWWETLQPEWRVKSGRPFSQQLPQGGETWQSICKGGVNGFFIVILTLSWWLVSIGGVFDDDEFSQAFDDMLWVTDCMISTQSGKRKIGSGGKPTNCNKKQV